MTESNLNALLNRIGTLTPEEWAALSVASADQAGLSWEHQVDLADRLAMSAFKTTPRLLK